MLSRRARRPVLIGDPGVSRPPSWKFSPSGSSPATLRNRLRGKRLVALDLGAIVASTKYRGDFEERLKGILNEIEESEGRMITFIDELHTVISTGAAKGEAMDAGDILKPMLARGELRMVGATTLDEFRERIEKDPALERRFQQVFVGEPRSRTRSDPRGVRRYEAHHGVRISDAALVAAATLCDRYITGGPPRQGDRPHRRVRVRLRMEIDSPPAEIDELRRTVDRIKMEEFALAKESDPASGERLERLRADLADRQEQLTALVARWEQGEVQPEQGRRAEEAARRLAYPGRAGPEGRRLRDRLAAYVRRDPGHGARARPGSRAGGR